MLYMVTDYDGRTFEVEAEAVTVDGTNLTLFADADRLEPVASYSQPRSWGRADAVTEPTDVNEPDGADPKPARKRAAKKAASSS